MYDNLKGQSPYESLAEASNRLDMAGTPSYLENTFISGDRASLREIYVQSGLPGLLAAEEGWGDPSDGIDHAACYAALDQAGRSVRESDTQNHIKGLTIAQLAIRRRVVGLHELAQELHRGNDDTALSLERYQQLSEATYGTPDSETVQSLLGRRLLKIDDALQVTGSHKLELLRSELAEMLPHNIIPSEEEHLFRPDPITAHALQITSAHRITGRADSYLPKGKEIVTAEELAIATNSLFRHRYTLRDGDNLQGEGLEWSAIVAPLRQRGKLVPGQKRIEYAQGRTFSRNEGLGMIAHEIGVHGEGAMLAALTDLPALQSFPSRIDEEGKALVLSGEGEIATHNELYTAIGLMHPGMGGKTFGQTLEILWRLHALEECLFNAESIDYDEALVQAKGRAFDTVDWVTAGRNHLPVLASLGYRNGYLKYMRDFEKRGVSPYTVAMSLLGANVDTTNPTHRHAVVDAYQNADPVKLAGSVALARLQEDLGHSIDEIFDRHESEPHGSPSAVTQSWIRTIED